MNDFIIREATLEDIDNGLLNVYIEGYEYHQASRPDVFISRAYEQLREDLIKDFDKLSIIIIIDKTEIVGYLSYKIVDRRNRKLDLNQLVIKEDYRGKGLGKILIEEAKKIAIENNCSRIELNCWLFNKNALAMYEHIGFCKQRMMYEMKLK
jgi:ribosomal protein S18 acetylase RimI-like enzyme